MAPNGPALLPDARVGADAKAKGEGVDVQDSACRACSETHPHGDLLRCSVCRAAYHTQCLVRGGLHACYTPAFSTA